VYDTVLACIRRIHMRRSIFSADKFHLHHRLLRMGLSQRQVVLFLYLISIYMCCLALLFVLIPEQYVLLLLALLALGLWMGMQTMRFVELKLLRRLRRRRVRREA
jgi:UDP-GlcNAc:undecaprenyl-phosphate GlcNAc-1-phosphate transferase